MGLLSETGMSRRTRLQQWLRIQDEARSRVYLQVHSSAEIRSLSYWLGIVLSAGIATLGLVESSPAVIIGAMLISPLMGPIMATGLGLASGDLYLTLKALANLIVSIVLAVSLSAVLVWAVPFHSATGEILARTNPTLLDLGIAVLSGLAGAIAVARSGGSSGESTLPGVAIAVALMPPLCTVGFGLGSGVNAHIMGGAALLFLTNLVAITASAFTVFLLVGMNSPDIKPVIAQSHENEAVVQQFSRTAVGRMLTGGSVRWRIVLLVVLLVMVGWPLRSALRQLAGEAVAREAVQTELKKLVPDGVQVSRQVEVGRESIAVRVVATQVIPADAVAAAEKQIAARTHRHTQIIVATVASQSEIAQLMQKLDTQPVPAPAPTAPQPLGDIRSDLLSRVDPALKTTWPAEAPVQNYTLAFDSDSVTLDVRYQSDEALTPLALGILQRDLQNALASPALQLRAERIRPPSAARKRRGH